MYQKLFEPGTINRLRLKNRIVLPAMGTGFDGWNGEASEDLIAYFEERARGGAGLIITGYCRVDSELGYLVLVTEEGDFYKLDLNGTDVSGLEPGDAVTAAYTGTLSTDEEGEDLSAQLVSIQKD